MEVKLETTDQIRTLGETVILLHIMTQCKVTIGGFTLRQVNGIVKPNMQATSKLLVDIVDVVIAKKLKFFREKVLHTDQLVSTRDE